MVENDAEIRLEFKICPYVAEARLQEDGRKLGEEDDEKLERITMTEVFAVKEKLVFLLKFVAEVDQQTLSVVCQYCG